MPDSVVLLAAGIFTAICLLAGGFGMYRAIKIARKNDSELAMVFWSVLAVGGLSFAGMCIAYFIVPLSATDIFNLCGYAVVGLSAVRLFSFFVFTIYHRPFINF